MILNLDSEIKTSWADSTGLIPVDTLSNLSFVFRSLISILLTDLLRLSSISFKMFLFVQDTI